MMSFENTVFLLGLLILLPLILLFILALRWKKKTKRALGDEMLISQLTKNYSPKLYRLKFIIVLLALALSIIAAANLRKPVIKDNESTAGIDVMIAMDVSKSMLATDIKPSRLERAKQLATILIANLENNRIGLVVFAGQAFLQMPLTPDITEARMYLSNISTEMVPVQGTVISEALHLCDNSLDIKEKTHKAIILITDGEDHAPGIEKALQGLSDDGVVVYTIGMGSISGSTIPDGEGGTFKTDIHGKTVISKLDEVELKKIAAETGGNYYRMDNVLVTAAAITNALNSMGKKLIQGKTGERKYLSFAPWFIAVALILLIAEIFLPENYLKPSSGFRRFFGSRELHKS